MPSLGQKGGSMNDSLAQQLAQTPSPSTGSRQATHSVGNAMSSARRAACRHAPRQAESAPRRWPEMERDGDASASMGARLAPPCMVLKRETNGALKTSSAGNAQQSKPDRNQERIANYIDS